MRNTPRSTSWEPVKEWYDQSVGVDGHYYHRQIILPMLLKAWSLKPGDSVLDLACGQGILARQLPGQVPYVGVDISPSLIKAAQAHDKNKAHNYLVGDISKPLPLDKLDFSHAAIILALQNVAAPEKALVQAAKHLRADGHLSLVINHPCFRIPRQSSWGVDEAKKLQYRRIELYMSSLKIPIQAHPGKPSNETETLSFHWPLSQLTYWLREAGFLIVDIEEWCSDKESSGAKAKMENRARLEFPLFMSILAKKTHIV